MKKKAVKMIEKFDIHPAGYKSKIDDIFAAVGTDNKNACAQLRRLVSGVKEYLTAEQTEHVTASLDILSSSKDKIL